MPAFSLVLPTPSFRHTLFRRRCRASHLPLPYDDFAAAIAALLPLMLLMMLSADAALRAACSLYADAADIFAADYFSLLRCPFSLVYATGDTVARYARLILSLY